MAANLTPQAQRSLEKKNHIFNISMEMFRDQGYNQTTIRDICAAAGVTTGTFYNFFGDKFGILQANIEVGLNHPDTAGELKEYIKKIAKDLD